MNHREIILTENACAGQEYRIILSAFTGDQNFSLRLCSAIKVLDRKTEKYFYDLSVPYEVARLLPEDDRAYLTILNCLNESLNLLDFRKEGSGEYYESLEKAQEYIYVIQGELVLHTEMGNFTANTAGTVMLISTAWDIPT